MNDKFSLNKIFENILPFILVGVMVVILFNLIFIFSYVLLWGFVIGAILWAGALLKNYLFSRTSKIDSSQKENGRIIEHDDNKE